MTSRPAAQTICVLGGTGFIGREIAGELIRRGYRVRVPTRDRRRARSLQVLPGVEVVTADIHNEAALRALFADATAVINLVGILNEKRRDGSGFHRVHVELVEKIVDACQESGVHQLLHVSALKANAETGPSHYLRTKGAGEQAVKNLSGDELHYTIFQPSVVFGPGDDFINRFAKLLRIAPILPLAKPNARFAPVFVGDVARAVCAALKNHHAYDRTFQLYGPNEYTLREIVEEIAAELGLRRHIIGLSEIMSRIQAWLFDYLVPGRIFTMDNFRSLAVASVGTENGLAALGISPTPMRSVIPRYVNAGAYQRQLSGFRTRRGS
ncbi:MAG TPA: complex I NDUFA9 subunit family protein [Gammaproteobacteria bacterium]